MEIGGTMVLAFMIGLSVISGIGGGGIVVPLLMIFYNMPTKKAVAISGFTILLGSAVRYVTTLKSRHPNKDATCIEYSIVNIMLPNVLLGSITGVFINQIMPEIILQVSLMILLGFLTTSAAYKAQSVYNKETLEFDEIEKTISKNQEDWELLTP